MRRVFTQTFGCVGAIIERDGKFLLVKENFPKTASQPQHPDHGKWNQPAGWIDVGEHPVTAVKREVAEETGYDFTPTAILGVYSLVRRDLIDQAKGTPHAIKIIFVGQMSDQPTQAMHGDTSEIGWFTPAEIAAMTPDILRDPDIKQLVKDYLAGQSFPLTLITHTVAGKSKTIEN